MALFFKELKNKSSRKTYSIGDFSESKDKWDKVSYKICGKLHVMCSCVLFEAEEIVCKYIMCILWRNHVTYILESYIL